MRLVLIMMAAIALLASERSDQARVILEAARKKETVDGDLKGAIQQYRIVATKFAGERALAADALIKMAECYRKLGDAESKKIYEQVLRDYADQKEPVALARARLGRGEPAGQAGIVVRQVWSGVDVHEGHPSPDGRRIVWSNYPNVGIYDLASRENRNVTEARGNSFAENPLFTPDGRQVVYSWYNADTDKYELKIGGADGSGQRIVMRDCSCFPTAIAPDGKTAAITHYKDKIRRIGMVNLTSGKLTVLKSLAWSNPDGGNFSPDGRYYVYSELVRQDAPDQEVYAIATDGSSESKLVAAPGVSRYPLFTPDGSRVVFTSNRSGRWDLWSVRVSGGKAQAAPELLKSDIGRMTNMGFARDGTLFFSETVDQRDAYFVEMDTAAWKVAGTAKRVSDRLVGSTAAPGWSPDGKLLVYISDRTRAFRGPGEVTFILRDTATSQERDMTVQFRQTYSARDFRWFPDSKSLLLAEWTGQGRFFRRLDLSTGQARPLFETKGSNVTSTSIAPDGSAVLFSLTNANDGHLKHLMLHNLETGEEHSVLQVRENGNGPPAFRSFAISPDGKLVAYLTGIPGGKSFAGWSLRVAALSGKENRELWRSDAKFIMPGSSLAWTPDSRGILLTATADHHYETERHEVWYVPVDGREPHSIGITMDGIEMPRLSPDGHLLGFTAGIRTGQVWTLKDF